MKIMVGDLNEMQIEDVLQQQLIGHLGCHNDGITYIIPVSYAYDGKYVFMHTSTEGKKIEMMRKNPEVCFQVDQLKNMGNWQSVIAWGRYEEITDEAEKANALQKLIDRNLPVVSSSTTHLGKNWPFPPKDLSSIPGIVFRIELKNKTGRFESNEETPFFAV
jgi:uncharacterized protein